MDAAGTPYPVCTVGPLNDGVAAVEVVRRTDSVIRVELRQGRVVEMDSALLAAAHACSPESTAVGAGSSR